MQIAIYPMVAPPPPAPTVKLKVVLDIECYRNFFLVKLYYLESKRFYSFRFTAQQSFNWLALRSMLVDCTIITFNGNGYDMVMLSAIATGHFNNDMLKQLSDAIIVGYTNQRGEFITNGQAWMIAADHNFKLLEGFDHIDLIEAAPGVASLKIYGGRLHCQRMQDLPIEPSAILSPKDMDDIDTYCGNDLITTASLYYALLDDIDTRIELSTQYGMDMRSRSDAQIAEAAFKKLLNLSPNDCKRMVREAQPPRGHTWKYKVPAFLSYTSPEMQAALERVRSATFAISDKGIAAMPPELEGYLISFGGMTYKMGIGGLHSQEQKTAHRRDANTRLVDFDVASYYPKIISILRLFPHQIGEVFLSIYDGWIVVRIEYKNKGNKKKAATFKIKLNGTFGKTNSKYSILFAPEMFIQIVITGQLSILMLIDMLHARGIGAVSANTDGVVTRCRPDQEAERDAIVKRWEALTGFEMEANEYLALFSRDVNNYLAAKMPKANGDIEFKSKGTYADFSLAKNPERMICVDAVKDYIAKGTPLEKTIRGCTDIRKFVTVKAVKGGGVWVHDTISAERVPEKRAALVAAGWNSDPKGQAWYRPDGFSAPRTTDAALRTLRAEIPRTYLGKAVRWYYGAGQRGHIAYATNGNLVARSEGAKPCMDLPDVLPCDLDYPWYVAEAQSLLRDLGVNCS